MHGYGIKNQIKFTMGSFTNRCFLQGTFCQYKKRIWQNCYTRCTYINFSLFILTILTLFNIIILLFQLKVEVERCETLKKENIKQFIEKLRCELNDLWDRCHFGDRQRKQCQVYYSTEFNEDVMDILDIEVDNAKKFYNDNM